jgi:hypothetical protein
MALNCRSVEMAERNAVIPEDRRIEFRIGINVGDAIVDDQGDIYGDGVNIASRVESLAWSGAVCLSDEAYRQIKGKLAIDVSDMGMHQLKNITQSVRVYCVWLEDDPPLALPDKPSIAVLPFENLSGEARSTDYGMREFGSWIRTVPCTEWVRSCLKNPTGDGRTCLGAPEGKRNGNYRHGPRTKETIELWKLIKSLL